MADSLTLVPPSLCGMSLSDGGYGTPGAAPSGAAASRLHALFTSDRASLQARCLRHAPAPTPAAPP